MTWCSQSQAGDGAHPVGRQWSADERPRLSLRFDRAARPARRLVVNGMGGRSQQPAAAVCSGALGDVIAGIGRDLTTACRSLLRTPTFAATVVLILSIGIGSNAAVLGVIDAAFYRRPRVPRPEQMIGVFSIADRQSNSASGLADKSFTDYSLLKDRVRDVQGVAAYRMAMVSR